VPVGEVSWLHSLTTILIPRNRRGAGARLSPDMHSPSVFWLAAGCAFCTKSGLSLSERKTSPDHNRGSSTSHAVVEANPPVTGSYDGNVRLWERSSGKEIRTFSGHHGWVFRVVFSLDGKYILSSGADATVRLWDAQTGPEVRRFTGHTNEVRNVTFSPDGKYILTASNDGTARLWLTDIHDTIRIVCALLTRDLTSDERT
jgi:WD40 repeat protein